MKVELLNITNEPIELIYKAFRICYSKDRVSEMKLPSDEEMCIFIKDKLDINHESPLEHVSMTFLVEDVSRSLLAQLTRHRTGKFSVQSQRYVNSKNFSFVMPEEVTIDDDIREYTEFCLDSIQGMVVTLETNLRAELGLTLKEAQEVARCLLPNATTCNLIVTFDLRNFRHFFAERNCIHAQDEIRRLANRMMKLVTEQIPFADYEVMKCGKLCYQCTNNR